MENEKRKSLKSGGKNEVKIDSKADSTPPEVIDNRKSIITTLIARYHLVVQGRKYN